MDNTHWSVMNDLSDCITNFVLVENLLKQSNGDKKLVDAITVILGHYISDMDHKFNTAWDQVIRNQLPSPERTQYTDEELDLMCLTAELKQWKDNYKQLEELYLKCVNDKLEIAQEADNA